MGGGDSEEPAGVGGRLRGAGVEEPVPGEYASRASDGAGPGDARAEGTGIEPIDGWGGFATAGESGIDDDGHGDGQERVDAGVSEHILRVHMSTARRTLP